jgi:L-asparaginase
MSEAAILVLTTGGTIDKQYFDTPGQYRIADTMVSRLLGIARVTHPVCVEELLRKDSLELSDGDREMVVQHIIATPATRIVITHGTDTMTQTAKALMHIEEKTIVLTGALAPARFSESDASFNLGMAIATAQIATPGVYITMNGFVFPALATEKDHSRGVFVEKLTSP